MIELTTQMFRRPVRDMTGEIHYYATRDAYIEAFRQNWPNTRVPRGAAYRDPVTGHIHLSPAADLWSLVHETIHKISRESLPAGRQLFGAFLDEGITEAVTRDRVGPRPASRTYRGRYEANVAFVRRLQSGLGVAVVENAILHGDYRSFRAAVKRAFGGSEQRTFDFLNRVRNIDSGVTRNQQTLDQAIAIWDARQNPEVTHEPSDTVAGRPPVHDQPEESNERLEPNARMETIAGIRVLTVEVREGEVIHRRIGAMANTRGPSNETGPFTHFIEHLLADARNKGAKVLRITFEFGVADNLRKMHRFVAKYGGTINDIDANTLEYVFPLSGR